MDTLELLAARIRINSDEPLSTLLRRLRPLEKIGLVAFHGGAEERRIALSPAGLCRIRTANDTVADVCARQAVIENIKRLKDEVPASMDDTGTVRATDGQ